MDERPKKRRGPMGWLAGRSRRFWIGVGAPLFLMTAYLLSVGPIHRLRFKFANTISFEFVRAYGAPYHFIRDHIPEPLGDVMSSYELLWVLDIFAQQPTTPISDVEEFGNQPDPAAESSGSAKNP